MTDSERKYAAWCVAHDPHRFYTWTKWQHTRSKVLAMDRNECQVCRHKYNRYRRADTVHHVNHFKARPDLALEMYYKDPATHEKRRNLISLCHECHEAAHGYRKRKDTEPLTEERWD